MKNILVKVPNCYAISMVKIIKKIGCRLVSNCGDGADYTSLTIASPSTEMTHYFQGAADAFIQVASSYSPIQSQP